MNTYEIGNDGYWTGQSYSVDGNAGIQKGWTRSEVPLLSSNEYAFWIGKWVVVTQEPPVTPYDSTKDSIIRTAANLIHTQNIVAKLVIKGKL